MISTRAGADLDAASSPLRGVKRNFLLNNGGTLCQNGELQPEETLKRTIGGRSGAWLQQYGEEAVGTAWRAVVSAAWGCPLTRSGNRIYVHFSIGLDQAIIP